MAASKYKHELEIAVSAAKEAGRILVEGAKKLPKIEIKSDRSPVTRLDRLSEKTIADRISAAFPHDAILGEENGERAGTSGRRWIVDPLDGTRPFLRGIPTYSVLIALEDAGEIVVGCMYFPALDECYTAAKGMGAFCDGRKIHVSKTAQLSSAMLSGLGPTVGGGHSAAGMRKLLATADYAYGFMDAYSYALVASGHLDGAISLWDKPWDCAAASCIVREAGGRFSDLSGVPSVFGGASVTSNGILHPELLAYLS